MIDQIGQRLDHPDRVPREFQHLIADDRQRVKRILEFPVSGRVLDVGCSDGSITRRIKDAWGVRVLGIDRYPAHGWEDRRDVFLYQRFDIRLPLDMSAQWVPFDVVYACEVFEHLTDADAQLALTNILTVLKPGGDLIVTVPNRDCAEEYVAGCRDRWKWPDHRSVWTFEKLRACLARAFPVHQFVPLYPEDAIADSIWLIVRAKGKR